MQSPYEYYTERKAHYNELLAAIIKKYNRVSSLRLLVVLGMIVAGICAYRSSDNMLWWLTAAVAAVFLALVRIHSNLVARREVVQVHIDLLENELQALNGNNSNFANGVAYADIVHPYSYDLDIFGNGSIYQMLCRTVTSGGALLLAERLSKLSASKDAITERQAITKELSTRPAFLQDFRVAGTLAKEGAKDQVRVTDWLKGEAFFVNNTLLRIAIVLMPILSITAIVWPIVTGGSYAYLSIVVLVNWIILGSFQKMIKLAAQQIGSTAPLIDKYERLLKEVSTQKFNTAWLNETTNTARASLQSIGRFKKLLRLFDSRGNSMIWPVMNSLFLIDLYCLYRLENWRVKNATTILAAIDSTITMDAFVSSATYAFNHPDNIYPTIAAIENGIQAKDLRHPLLPANTAVGNDLSLGSKEQFYLLTGANMTGKSTFIRTIGATGVLCNLGLPVPAKEFSMPLLELYTSMRITDSVQDDISYFKAELNRMKAIIDKVSEAGEQHYLILLDEPLRGTNSVDKQQGTRAILEKLLDHKAIGIIATHDTSLCDMEQIHPGRVRNYHFESKVGTEGLSFDFKLKSGGSTSNNATILMRQMGIVN